MQHYLFIGGHQDGLNIRLADDVEYIQLANGAKDRETYIRDTLAVGAFESFTFYRRENLTPEHVLNLLVERYTAWAVKPPGKRR